MTATADLSIHFDALLDEHPTAQNRLSLPPVPTSAEALLLAALARRCDGVLLWVGPGLDAMQRLLRDVDTLWPSPAPPVMEFPPWEVLPDGRTKPDADLSGARLAALTRLAHGERGMVVTCVQALMQHVVPRETLGQDSLELSEEMELEREAAVEHLDAQGYDFAPEVEEKGQATVRGGLVDAWPLDSDYPVRIEFDGMGVSSLRTFDPATQRSIERLASVALTPVGTPTEASAVSPLTYLPERSSIVWSDRGAIESHALAYSDLLKESKATASTSTLDALDAALEGIAPDLEVRVHALDPEGTVALPCPAFTDPPRVPPTPADAFEPDQIESHRRDVLHDLVERARRGVEVRVFLDTEGALAHCRAALPPTTPDSFRMDRGILSEGFVCDAWNLVIASQPELYGQRKREPRRARAAGRARAASAGERLSDLSHVLPGDLVVHVEHGIGRYLGLNEIAVSGTTQEVISIEYAGDAKLHVPVSQAHLLSRYVGASQRSARLHHLGGKRWNKEKERAGKAIMDLAASLLETQAHRDLLEGVACPPDAPWQHEFEATFPYRETVDQERVIHEVKTDLESTHPMDRLVCGDAGYGKTEIAMRAAFKVALAGRQTAMLVPTTILAQQHFDTFVSRMAGYPLRVEMLSRFRSTAQRRVTMEGVAAGTVDIVIGTHALLNPAVRFKDLGLVIIDEEQRFGVAHKERFKEMRRLVDVLTLTATPIPRTLYLSMTGARDMSLLQTPPRERMAIETVICRQSDDVVRKAILRELNREGQVFYLHNRVMTIDRVARELRRLVPEARIGVGHGQMKSAELAAVMHAFVNGAFDVLLCTTIIESGVDIPRANTILIDRADRFGIADLYQLRGRVGRSSHKAYAYLLLPEHGILDTDARKRMAALRKYSDLSVGFNLALRDLEIRGAGNILGAEQSGNITSIGFGLYCQLLRRTVAQLKGEKVRPLVDVETRIDFIRLTAEQGAGDSTVAIPYDYIEDETLRVAIYRRFADAARLSELRALATELKDRFGPVPRSVKRLMLLAELRVRAAAIGITFIETRNDKVMMRRHGEWVMANQRFPRLHKSATADRLKEMIGLVKQHAR